MLELWFSNISFLQNYLGVVKTWVDAPPPEFPIQQGWDGLLDFVFVNCFPGFMEAAGLGLHFEDQCHRKWESGPRESFPIGEIFFG